MLDNIWMLTIHVVIRIYNLRDEIKIRTNMRNRMKETSVFVSILEPKKMGMLSPFDVTLLLKSRKLSIVFLKDGMRISGKIRKL